MCQHECRCICHTPGLTVRHIMACCGECPKCKRHILPGLMKEHNMKCHPGMNQPKEVER
jgi:hypothetical protein